MYNKQVMKIDQLFRSKRRKTIALIIDQDGQLIVRAPIYTSDRQIKRIVGEKSAWIQRKQREIRTRLPTTRLKRFQDGENFYYLGRGYPLELSKRQKPPLNINFTFSLAESARKYPAQVFK